MRVLICVVAALAGSLSTGRTLLAQQFDDRRPVGSRSHSDEVAREVERAAGSVATEISRSHRSHRNFRMVYREAREMWAVARHVHDLLHEEISSERLERNVGDLDELFHHLEEHVTDWDVDYSAGSELDSHGHEEDAGHGSENQLLRKMARLEQTLHHLMDETNVETAANRATNDVRDPRLNSRGRIGIPAPRLQRPPRSSR